MNRIPATALLLALTLSACATPQTGVQVVKQDVYVPVPVPCVKQSDIAAEPAPVGVLPSDARASADLLGAADLTLRAWGHGLAAVLQACVDHSPASTAPANAPAQP